MKVLEDITPFKLITLLVTVAGAVSAASVAATWQFCQKTQSDELQGYKAAQELHLKDAISSLSSYAEAAKLTSDERARLTALDRQLPALMKANTDMKTRLDEVTRDRDSLKVTVSSMLQKNTEIEVPVGEAHWIVPNLVTIGVTSVDRSYIEATFNGAPHLLDVGGQLPFDLAGKRYTVTLTKIEPSGATFVVTLPVAG
ncbi:MAG: hypothetical protein EPN70_20440 [Paraburkholderia sp.]|uniref:hypothetical protein n=1 Tax=Paraburkholderia sp. TaxID=1926495 RepID=UPI001229B338|nr:hypothetical protein [Paraburkholderia sp.]TAM01116.1 MAG: hypothetical protein EPN70_20440 [Paraburkholderia sp.]TAM30389.1 MAG: hypothetical protein EPN59_09530 [Paraburkholderia sp.]